MTITARFASTCPKCHNPIPVGTLVRWEPRGKATHVVCPAAAAPKPPVARLAVEDAGVYILPDGSIAKVKATQDKLRTYASRWVEIRGERLTEAGTRKQGEYQYEQGLVQRVAAQGRKMTLEEAKAFILRYGICARCSRKLVAADSVERGIGPVCVTYFNS